MSKIVLSIHNIHTWGKPLLTRSGDINILEDIANNVRERNLEGSDTINEIVYAAISNDNLKQLHRLYPTLKFTHFGDFETQGDEVFIMPMIDTRGQDDCFAEELKSFYHFITNYEHVVMNICRQDDYYTSLIESIKDKSLKLEMSKLLSTSKAYMTHHPTNVVELFEELEQVSHSENQLLSFSFKDNLKMNDHSQHKSIVFNRPSSMKGFPLWLDFVLDERYQSSYHDTLYVGNISGLSKIDKIKADFENKYNKNFDEIVEIHNSISSFNKNKVSDKPHIVNRGYQQSEIEELAKDYTTFIVSSDYNHISGDYVMIEYAMLEALQYGLRLRWSRTSISTMFSNYKFSAAKDAKRFNQMSYDEQVEYFKEAYSPDLFTDRVIEAAKK